MGVFVAPGGLPVGPWHVGATLLWGLTVSVAMLIVALVAPYAGAWADKRQGRLWLMRLFTLMCIVGSFGLGFVLPYATWPAIALYVFAIVGYELSFVFYSAYLPDLAEPHEYGQLSSRGWALGYVGGLLALVCALPLLPKQYDIAHATNGAWVYWIVAAWFLVFSLPALFMLKPLDAPAPAAVPASAPQTPKLNIWRALRTPGLGIFLVTYFLYTEGVTTVIEFTGAFTKEVLSFTPKDNVILFLILNIIAAPGALLFGTWLDRIGPRRAVRRALVAWCIVCVGAALVSTRAMFWPVAALAAVALGAIQSASRAWMARIAPKDRMSEYMGLLALSGKASAIVGPALFGICAEGFGRLTSLSMGYRLSMLVFALSFVVAWHLTKRVPEEHV